MTRPKPKPARLRDVLCKLAQKIVRSAKLPKGARIVVAITDKNGEWVGVGSNTTLADTFAILTSARHGSDFEPAAADIVDMQPAALPESTDL